VTRGLPRAALGVADELGVVALAMTGDDAAFCELVRRRQGPIRNLLRRLCRDGTLADDLSQAAFLQAWRSLSTLRSPAAFGGWLRKLAVNTWLQHARRRSHGTEREPNENTIARAAAEEAAGFGADAASMGPQSSYEAAVTEKLDLDRGLALLPHDVRLCIVLAYSEQMSHREISEATGFPLGTVKSHITRGSARLREILNAYG
jgi:RNA polymerase sigma-70 factor (ECF subfamily)